MINPQDLGPSHKAAERGKTNVLPAVQLTTTYFYFHSLSFWLPAQSQQSPAKGKNSLQLALAKFLVCN